jgi:hypothetical protein
MSFNGDDFICLYILNALFRVSGASKFGGSPSLRPDNGFVASTFYLPSGLHDAQYGQRTKPEWMTG